LEEAETVRRIPQKGEARLHPPGDDRLDYRSGLTATTLRRSFLKRRAIPPLRRFREPSAGRGEAGGVNERQRRPLARLAIEEPLDLSRGRRASEEVALAEAAAELPQALRLRRMLDALRHGRQAERIREAQDRVDERLVRILADELVHE